MKSSFEELGYKFSIGLYMAYLLEKIAIFLLVLIQAFLDLSMDVSSFKLLREFNSFCPIELEPCGQH